MLIYKFYFHLKKKTSTPPLLQLWYLEPRLTYITESIGPNIKLSHYLSQDYKHTPPLHFSKIHCPPPNPPPQNKANTKRREKYWYWFIWRSGCIVMIFFASTKQFVQQPTFYNMDSFHQVMSYNRIHFWDRLSYHKSCTLVMERL